jgi:hypothetical protein
MEVLDPAPCGARARRMLVSRVRATSSVRSTRTRCAATASTCVCATPKVMTSRCWARELSGADWPFAMHLSFPSGVHTTEARGPGVGRVPWLTISGGATISHETWKSYPKARVPVLAVHGTADTPGNRQASELLGHNRTTLLRRLRPLVIVCERRATRGMGERGARPGIRRTGFAPGSQFRAGRHIASPPRHSFPTSQTRSRSEPTPRGKAAGTGKIFSH